MDDVLIRAPGNWYIEANEARSLDLCPTCCENSEDSSSSARGEPLACMIAICAEQTAA